MHDASDGWLDAVLDSLPVLERQAVDAVYGLRLSQQAAADTLGVTRQVLSGALLRAFRAVSVAVGQLATTDDDAPGLPLMPA